MSLRIPRRSFLQSTGALIAAGTLGLHPVLAQDSRVRLIFWGSQARADRTYSVADLFAQNHAGTTIEGEFLSWTDYWPKLATQTAGGNPPDIMQMDYRYIGEYARRGTLAALDSYVGERLRLDAFDKDQLSNGTIDGGLFGVSLGVAAGAVVYNARALADAGIEIAPMAWTYDDLLAKGRDFAAATSGTMALAPDGSGIELLFENWLRQRGKALYTPEGGPAFDAADITQWFELWAQLREAGAVVSADEQALDTGALESSPLVRGKAAMNFTTSNQLVAYQTLIADPLGIAIYPAIASGATGGHYRNSSQYFSISARSPAADAAIAFVDYFVNSPEAAALLGVERGVPASATMREAVIPHLDERSRMAVQYISDLGAISGPVPPTPPAAAGEIEVALKTKSQEVAFGAQSPADAGPAFFQEVVDTLGRAR